MTRFNRRQALVATTLLGSAVLFGCGGGGSSNGTTTASAEGVSLTESATRVTISSTSARGSHQWSAMQFTFTADVTAGTHAGSTISGLLLLKGESNDEDDDDDSNDGSSAGATEVEGKLLIGTLPTMGNANAAQGQALRSAFRDQAEVLRTAVKAELVKLRDQLKADLAAATDDAAKQAAKDKFTTAFKALMDKFQQDMAALVSQLRDQLVALGLDPSRFLPGGGDGSRRGHGRGGFEVKGIIAADGSITGTVEFGSDQVIKVTGQSLADGGFEGSFTGPASDDAGKWKATAVTAPTVPVPTPPASAAGA